MSLIAPPPNIKKVFEDLKSISRVLLVGENPQLRELLYKANDQYMYWSDILHRVPKGLNFKAEEIWAYLKIVRSANSKSTPLSDKDNRSFTFWTPDGLHKSISEVDKWSGGRIITHQPHALPSKEKYIISCLMDEAIASSQLEGASTEHQVAKEMLRSGRKPKDKHEQMIFNNWKAMQYIRQNIKNELTLDRLIELHILLTQNTLDDPNDCGRLRETDDIEVRYKDEVVHIPPKAHTLKDRLVNLFKFANTDEEATWIHPVIKGAMIHFWLAYDHPFVDGNGRTARALMYWYLLNRDYDLFQYLSISKHFLRAPGQYARAYLYTEHDDNDLTYFLIYNLDSIRVALQELVNYLQTKQHELSEVNRLLQKFKGLNFRQKSLVYHSIQYPETVYSIDTHKNTYGLAYETARKDITALVSKGFLKPQRQGKRRLLFYATGKSIEKIKQ